MATITTTGTTNNTQNNNNTQAIFSRITNRLSAFFFPGVDRVRNVARRLRAVQSHAIACFASAIVALICAAFTTTDKNILIVGAFLYAGVGVWFRGYARAIVNSAEERQNYLTRTRRCLRRLNTTITVLLVVALALAVQAVVLAGAIKLGMFNPVVELFPDLLPLAEVVIEWVNNLLGSLLALVA